MGNIVKTILKFGKVSKGILVATVPKASKISKQQ